MKNNVQLFALGAGALLAWLAWRSAAAGVEGLVSGIKAGVSAAVDAVYQPENAVSATAGSYGDVEWTKAGDITPLVNYFQANGNTVATRNEAAAKGWTRDQISLAVATMGSLAGYY